MQFADEQYDPETLALLNGAFDQAWAELQKHIGVKPLDPAGLQRTLALRIIVAAREGERDPRKLKLIALRAIDAYGL